MTEAPQGTTWGWLIHRPVLDYEESIVPYMVCWTEEDRDATLKQLRSWLQDFAESLPKMEDENGEWLGEESFAKNSAKHQKMMSSVAPPFGLMELLRDIRYSSNAVTPGCIEAMAIPMKAS